MSKRLDEIEARVAAATPGRWEPECDIEAHGSVPSSYSVVSDGTYERVGESISKEDAALIANAPADLRHLLAIARAAERLVEAEADPEGDIDAATAAFLDLRAALEAKEDVR